MTPNLEIKFPDHYHNLNISVKGTPQYALLEGKNLLVTDKLNQIVDQVLQTLKMKNMVFFVNQRKILLQQVYKNLTLQLKKYLPVEVEYLDSIKPGVFTNYKSTYFKEPESVFILLTKKHNGKELRLLSQLKKRHIKVYLLVLGLDYYDPAFHVIKVDRIKSLYYFLYALLSKTQYMNYIEFANLFKFEPKKVNFKEL